MILNHLASDFSKVLHLNGENFGPDEIVISTAISFRCLKAVFLFIWLLWETSYSCFHIIRESVVISSFKQKVHIPRNSGPYASPDSVTGKTHKLYRKYITCSYTMFRP